jgi:hypothetical protein
MGHGTWGRGCELVSFPLVLLLPGYEIINRIFAFLCFHQYRRMHLHFVERETGQGTRDMGARLRIGFVPAGASPTTFSRTTRLEILRSFVFINIAGCTFIF